MWPTIGHLFEYVQEQIQYLYYGDDRPVVIEDGFNIWPPHIHLRSIQRALYGLLPTPEDKCRKVSFLNYGSSHVVVKVETTHKNVYVLRITAAVFPKFQRTHPFWQPFKESSEVASMIALRKWTTIPVPRVYAFDEDKGNRIGGAWTLQEYIPGRPLAEVWPEMSGTAMAKVIEQLAGLILQAFHVSFHQIGSPRVAGSLCNIRNLSETDFEVRIGPIVTLKGLRHHGIIGPPKESGPFDDANGWLKSVARGDMRYQRQDGPMPDQNNIDRVICIIDEPLESNGLCLEGPLSVNGPWVQDMWSFQNILVVIRDGEVTVTGLVDMEGMQSLPAWARVQPLCNCIPDVDETWLKMLLDLLLDDPDYRYAYQHGSRARHLLWLAENAAWEDPEDERIREFRRGIWDDDAILAG
ncbi:hypothetical protein CALVIDRAFT_568648 [Calocera viscosa TUFC12733]|uniref:Aminoglycoside phosphotransferase domain-containing protein n=1 Tax=Calocera viscosa (strain TUFC12733) TaxID=1330018 RepID=A0A167GWA7_CALVF|nr:hypothetical protein CALVIDRAFT_568648 [Calocera viscosa TUFC12733]